MSVNNINTMNLKTKTPHGQHFDSLAKKLRMEKFDKNEILQLKNEAIQNEKLKNKKKKSAITIQKFYRGHMLRKKFQAIMDEINTNIIVEYFNNRRKERIRRNAKTIILRNLDRYIDRKREVKRIILYDYFNYCSTMIMKTYQGWKLRRNFIPILTAFKKSKDKISACINSFKVRLILRTNKIQDILVEIANIQNCLNMLHHDERNSDKTEKLKTEFIKRLPKVLLNLYEEFYRIKERGNWMNYIKCDRGWLDKFISIMTTGTFKNVFSENPNILNRSMTDLNSSKFIHNLNNYGNSGNNFYTNQMTMGLLNSSQENINAVVNMNKSVVIPEQKETTNPPVVDYDNKPIRVNPKKMYDWSKMELPPEDAETENLPNENKNINRKKKISPLRRKVPKYDARKAIEEAKEGKDNHENRGRSNDRGEFRKFLKEMRGEKENTDKEEKGDYGSNTVDKKPFKSPEKKYEASIGGFGGGGNVTASQDKPQKKNEEENTRRKKVVTTEINMRKKLHELEKSPPPKIDVKNIKSKIDCWGAENELTFNIKKIKGDDIDNFSKPAIKKREFYSKLEQDFKSINNGYLDDCLKNKTAKMKEYSSIPYIKTDSFYIKHYSNEIYEQLLLHLSKHYDELKN